uniref:uncharacterized protein n=1 Tax=Pristiophorus japonicus TaxID=55135 RepID=UPI00398E72DF
MSDKEAAAPISRKHRLMAAVLPSGDEGSPAGSARLHCFICGGWMSPGREQRLQVRTKCPAGAPLPYFPFLLHQEPAPGARELSAEGWVLVCSVCRCFLGEQWDSFERSRTPVDKRMYWLKRPHQCDGRAASQEWNPTFEPESSLAPGGRELDLPDSELSSLSDQDISDLELELEHISQALPPPPHQHHHHHHPVLAASARAPPFPGLPVPLASSAATHDAGLTGGHQAEPLTAHRPKRPASCQAKRGSVKRGPAGVAGPADPSSAPLPPPVSSSSDGTPNRLTPLKFSDSSDPSGYSSSSEDEIRITTSGDEEDGGASWNGELSIREVVRFNRQGREAGSVITKARGPAEAPDHSCFICGTRLLPASQHRVHVQKQESPSDEPFFPFLSGRASRWPTYPCCSASTWCP